MTYKTPLKKTCNKKSKSLPAPPLDIALVECASLGDFDERIRADLRDAAAALNWEPLQK